MVHPGLVLTPPKGKLWSMPSYGQRSDPRAAPDCPRHPGVRSVDYCKRCNRPIMRGLRDPHRGSLDLRGLHVLEEAVDGLRLTRGRSRHAGRHLRDDRDLRPYVRGDSSRPRRRSTCAPTRDPHVAPVNGPHRCVPARRHHAHPVQHARPVLGGRAIEPVLGRWRFLTLTW